MLSQHYRNAWPKGIAEHCGLANSKLLSMKHSVAALMVHTFETGETLCRIDYIRVLLTLVIIL